MNTSTTVGKADAKSVKQVARAAAQDAADQEARARGEAAGEVVEPAFIVVKTRPGVERFCRGGFAFCLEPRTLRLDDLTVEQVDAITREGMLTVEYGVDDAPAQAPGQQA